MLTRATNDYNKLFRGQLKKLRELDKKTRPTLRNFESGATAQQRKQIPIYSGVLKYFPDAIKQVAIVSWLGNEQHNKGEPLHWARDKSKDQLDAAVRHIVDHASGETIDSDGGYHLAKAAWRCLAELQLILEKEKVDNCVDSKSTQVIL